MIELKSVSAGYGRHTVLKNVSADIQKEMLTSIIGVNGCGKSTLLKAMLGILPSSSGEISIDGCNLSNMRRKEIAQKVAYLSQGKATPDMTVEQLVLHGRFPHLSYPRHYSKEDQEIAFSAMEQMGVANLAANPLYTLSGGMRQKAYIAMALAQDTDYILLDEPTTYLDIAHQLELMQTLRKLADRGKGIVAVMHDLPMAFTYCDQILLLDGGNVLAQGTPQEVYSHIEKVFGVGLEAGEHYHYKYLL
jgi:iron complex transport system ATP-binding protein